MNLLTALLFVRILLQSQAALYLSGVSTVEEMDLQTVEKFETLHAHPINLNTAPKSKLISCGLFNSYQAASIIDYRQRSGDILSFTELGLIDGIGEQMAEALREFVTLESKNAPGQRERKRFEGEALGRYGSSGWLAKGKFAYGNIVEGVVAFRDAGSSSSGKVSIPLQATGSAAYYGRRHLGKVVAGNFNTRFGQGLVMWSGTDRSGLSSSGSFRKRASGLSLSGTASPGSTMHGVGADFNFGKWTVSSMMGIGLSNGVLSLVPAANLGWMGRNGQFSLSGIAAKGNAVAGADWSWHLGKFDFYGEGAWDFYGKAPAAVAGVNWNIAYQSGINLLGRWYSPNFSGKWSAAARSSSKTSDEAGVTLGGRFKWFDFTSDAAWHPSKKTFVSKTQAVAEPEFKLGKIDLLPMMKAVLRYRPEDSNSWRTDLRGEVELVYAYWHSHLRADAVWCSDFAWLWYLEQGFKSEKFFVWLRGGLFKVDSWEDRIYVYERDVPGTFNVPAYYGRGWNLSLVAGAKLGGFPKLRHRINLRAATVQYPWTENKAAKWEWRLQYCMDW